MLSLSSSAENRINACKQSLVIALVGKKGRFWEAVCDIRQQWGIDATTNVPPPLPNSTWVHTPPGEPKYADVGEDGHEEWASFHYRWRQQLAELHGRFVPEDCRIGGSHISPVKWEKFLSACVLYDPPDKKLEESTLTITRLACWATTTPKETQGAVRPHTARLLWQFGG